MEDKDRTTRGIRASEIHGQLRHFYVTVDTTASNWKEYIFHHANRFQRGGILHVIDHYTFQEIERFYV